VLVVHKKDASSFVPVLPFESQIVASNQPHHTSLIIIDPNPLLREGLRKLFADSHFEVIASIGSAGGPIPPLAQQPAIALISGDEVSSVIHNLSECKRLYPSARRVVLSDTAGDRFSALLHAGAHVCLGRNVTINTLLITLDLAMVGADLVCRCRPHNASTPISIGRQLEEEAGSQAMQPHEQVANSSELGHRLSSREISILECLMHGDSNKLIARKFQISEATVKVHIKAILRKIRAANRTQAAIWAMTHLAAESQSGALTRKAAVASAA
jgi:two-component system, NarL family, nitrate/nitrite response regulator NarL